MNVLFLSLENLQEQEDIHSQGELAGTIWHTFRRKEGVITVVMDSGMQNISYGITGHSVAKES